MHRRDASPRCIAEIFAEIAPRSVQLSETHVPAPASFAKTAALDAGGGGGAWAWRRSVKGKGRTQIDVDVR